MRRKRRSDAVQDREPPMWDSVGNPSTAQIFFGSAEYPSNGGVLAAGRVLDLIETVAIVGARRGLYSFHPGLVCLG